MAFMIPWKVPDLLKRFKTAKSNWQLWRSLHQEAYDFSMPDRETFRFRSPGQRKNRHIFDSTAVDGLEVFANKVQGGFFPDWLQWMEFVAGEEIPKEEKDKINRDLEQVTNAFFGFFHQSNFSTEITPSLKDWGIGTGAIEVEEGEFNVDDELFKFSNIPLAEIYPEKPANGPVQTSYREHEVEVINIKATWPNAELTEDLEKMLESKPLSKVKIINAHVFDPKGREYHQIILYSAKKHILFAQKFKTKRRVVFRQNITPGEVFGRGPIIRMLPDIRTVNKVKQFILENAAIQMAGVYTGVDDGVFNPHTVRIAPGSIIPVTSNNNQNPTMRALDRAGDIGIGGLVIEDLQDGINRALLSKPLGDISDPVRSASEQIMRFQDDVKRSTTSFGRLYTELVVPIVKACLDIGVSLGKLPQIKADGKEVKIRMVSPLAKQQDIEDFQNSQLWWQNVQTLPQEVVMGTVKIESLPKYWADKLSVPSSELVRSEDEVQEFGETIVSAANAGLTGGPDGGSTQV
jgi:hypothetical protein